VLTASQQGTNGTLFSQTAGTIVVNAQVLDANLADTVALQWHAEPELVNVSTEPGVFEFDPVEVADGVYKVSLTATDDAGEPLSTTRTLNLRVANSLPVLGTGDRNNNLIPDVEEGRGDSNGNGIPNYLDNMPSSNILPQVGNVTSNHLVECDPGVRCGLGLFALSGQSGGVQILDGELNTLNIIQDNAFTPVGGIFDFSINDLPTPGQTVRIVIPQIQPVPAGGTYRKFQQGRWVSFVTDSNNSIHSAAGSAGYCPPPGSAEWQPGLIENAWCVQLTIEDGGPNDDDGVVNSSIVDPGVVSVPMSGNALPAAVADNYSVQWNESHELDVLTNDSDADADVLSITQVSANFGAVSISADSTQLIYTPAADFIGTDTLVYGLSDGEGGTGSAQVTVVVYFNQAPQVIATATASTNDRTAIEINALANASDADGDTLSISAASATQGTVSIVNGTLLRYVPKTGFDGTDTISFTVSDGRGGIAQGEVLVTVEAYEVITVMNKSSGGSTGVWGLMLLSLLLLRRVKSAAVLFSKGSAVMLMLLMSSVLLVSAPAVQATGLSFEGYIGQSKASQSASDIEAGLPAGTTLLSYDDSATAFALGGSFAFTDTLTLEAHYVDLGETTLSIQGDTLSAEQLHKQISDVGPLLAKGIRSGLSYTLLQAEGWSMAVQAGVFSWWSNSSSQYGNNINRTSDSDTDIYWGATAGYMLTEPLTLQLQYTRYNLSGNKADSVMLGLSYMF
jgi:hypothetical protein